MSSFSYPSLLPAVVAKETEIPDGSRSERRAQMLADSVNVTDWYVDLMDELEAGR